MPILASIEAFVKLKKASSRCAELALRGPVSRPYPTR
jgi:hypothetical protein